MACGGVEEGFGMRAVGYGLLCSPVGPIADSP